MDAALSAYLRRLGFSSAPAPPTLDTLVALHRAHLATIPYENLGIMLGSPPSADVTDTVERIAATGRAGYCFHHNGAFEALLAALGFRVSRRHGHVWTDEVHRWETSLNHLVLVVDDLPTAANPHGRWWVDVGLGDGFVDPLPLVAGRHDQDGFVFDLDNVSSGRWSFRHDPLGSFAGVEVSDRPIEVAAAHELLSTGPDSHFTRFLVVQRQDARGTHTLRGCVLSLVRPGRSQVVAELTSYDAWRAALADPLGLPLDDVDPVDLADLFDRCLAAHAAWVAAGRR